MQNSSWSMGKKAPSRRLSERKRIGGIIKQKYQAMAVAFALLVLGLAGASHAAPLRGGVGRPGFPGGVLEQLIAPCRADCREAARDCVDDAESDAVACMENACATEVAAAQSACATDRASQACKTAVLTLRTCGSSCLTTLKTATATCQEAQEACVTTCDAN
jgi:hypothetical protein